MPGVVLDCAPCQSTVKPTQKVEILRNALLSLERSYKYESSANDWKAKRDSWIAKVKAADKLGSLYPVAGQLEDCLKWEHQTPAWKAFQRNAVNSVLKSSTISDVSYATELALLLVEQERSIKNFESHEPTWKASGRAEWYRKLDSVCDPLELHKISINIVNKLPAVVDNRYKTFEDFVKKVAEYVKRLDEEATSCSKCHDDVAVARAAGGYAQYAGGILAIGGLALAPFSGGASLAFTAVGTMSGIAGGVTSGGAQVWNNGVQSGGGEMLGNEILNDVYALLWALSQCDIYNAKTRKFLETPEGRSVVMQCIDAAGVGKTVVGGISTTVHVVSVLSLANSMKIFDAALEADIALAMAAPALRMPLPKLFTCVVSSADELLGTGFAVAGSTSAKLAGGVFAGINVIFGVKEMMDAGAARQDGSEVAKKLHEASHFLIDVVGALRPVWKKEPEVKNTGDCGMCGKSLDFGSKKYGGEEITCPYENCRKAYHKLLSPCCSEVMVWAKGNYNECSPTPCGKCKKKFYLIGCPHCKRGNAWNAPNEYAAGSVVSCAYADCKMPIQKKNCPSCKAILHWKYGNGTRGAKTTCPTCKHTFTL